MMDYPPKRWFTEPITKGPYKGATLDKTKFDKLLDMYYAKRGWDSRGIPTKSIFEKLGLKDVAEQLSKSVALTP
jgi:aldehyde:ferredoxin oxidoreductase